MKIDPAKMKAAREAAGLHHRDIAVAADLGERRIWQIEQGKGINLNLNVAKAIAKRLGVKLEELV